MKLVFTYEYASLLALLYGLFILLFYYAIQKKRQRAMKFGNYETLERVAGRDFISSSHLVLFIRLVAITALIIGISSPVIVEQVPAANADYVVALDASGSMFTDDIAPTRFAAAKDVSQQFIRQLGNASKVGVVAYAGSVQKMTETLVDAPQAVSIVQQVEQGSTAGTAIGDAIMTSTGMLLNSNQSRRVILITDGTNNAGVAVNESISFAQQHNTSIYPLGIGAQQNGSQADYDMVNGQNASRAQFPNLDTQQLAHIANATGGNLTVVQDRSGFEQAFTDMTQQPKETAVGPGFVLIGIVLLLVDWLLKTTDYATLP